MADTVDTARALEVLQRVARDCKEPGTIALVALFAAAVELEAAESAFSGAARKTDDEFYAACDRLDAARDAYAQALAAVTKGVLGHE